MRHPDVQLQYKQGENKFLATHTHRIVRIFVIYPKVRKKKHLFVVSSYTHLTRRTIDSSSTSSTIGLPHPSVGNSVSLKKKVLLTFAGTNRAEGHERWRLKNLFFSWLGDTPANTRRLPLVPANSLSLLQYFREKNLSDVTLPQRRFSPLPSQFGSWIF